MTSVAPGWYKDPADPTTQRYWDGEGWLGAALPPTPRRRPDPHPPRSRRPRRRTPAARGGDPRRRGRSSR